MAEQRERKLTVPYVPFKTFLGTLDSLAAFFPDKIDTSIWHSFSGGIRSQLLSTYKFFGLITDQGQPTAELRALVNDKDHRNEHMREALKRGYSDLMKLDLAKATPNGFDAELRKFGQEGDTHRKAVSFFLAAAKFSGVPLSPLLLKRGTIPLTRSKKKNGGKKEQQTPAQSPAIQPPPMAGGSSKSIQLPDGTIVTVSTDRDAFQMSAADRKIVFKLIESLEEQAAPEEEDAESDDDDGES